MSINRKDFIRRVFLKLDGVKMKELDAIIAAIEEVFYEFVQDANEDDELVFIRGLKFVAKMLPESVRVNLQKGGKVTYPPHLALKMRVGTKIKNMLKKPEAAQ